MALVEGAGFGGVAVDSSDLGVSLSSSAGFGGVVVDSSDLGTSRSGSAVGPDVRDVLSRLVMAGLLPRWRQWQAAGEGVTEEQMELTWLGWCEVLPDRVPRWQQGLQFFGAGVRRCGAGMSCLRAS